jgi:hypothetical protein
MQVGKGWGWGKAINIYAHNKIHTYELKYPNPIEGLFLLPY